MFFAKIFRRNFFLRVNSNPPPYNIQPSPIISLVHSADDWNPLSIFDEDEQKYNQLIRTTSSSSSPSTPSASASAAQPQSSRQKRVKFALPTPQEDFQGISKPNPAKMDKSSTIIWQKNASVSHDDLLLTSHSSEEADNGQVTCGTSHSNSSNSLVDLTDRHHLPNRDFAYFQDDASGAVHHEPLQPHLSSKPFQNVPACAPELPLQHCESRIEKNQKATELGIVMQNGAKNPEDKGRSRSEMLKSKTTRPKILKNNNWAVNHLPSPLGPIPSLRNQRFQR